MNNMDPIVKALLARQGGAQMPGAMPQGQMPMHGMPMGGPQQGMAAGALDQATQQRMQMMQAYEQIQRMMQQGQ